MNLSEFRATAKRSTVAAMGELQGFETDDTRAAIVYTDDVHIAVNDDGTYHLQLGRAEWVSSDLSEFPFAYDIKCSDGRTLSSYH